MAREDGRIAREGAKKLGLVPVDPKTQANTKMAKAFDAARPVGAPQWAQPRAWAPAAPAQPVAAPNFTLSPGAVPELAGPPTPPRQINAPQLGLAPKRLPIGNEIAFTPSPEVRPVNPANAPKPAPQPISASTSLGAAPGRAVVPVDAGRSFSPPVATPAPRPNALVPVDAGRSFTPPYGAGLDPNTIYQPSNTSPGRALAVIDGAGRELVPTGQPGRTMTPPSNAQAPGSINIPSGYTPPKVDPATGAYANQGPAAPSPPSAKPPSTIGGAALAKGVAKGVGLGVAGYGAAQLMNDIGKDGAPGAAQTRTPELQQKLNQIPTGRSGAEPTPAAQPYSWWIDTETGRNVGNTLNALAPMGGAVSGALRAGSAAARLAGAGEVVAGGMAAGANSAKSQAVAPTPAPAPATPAPKFKDPGTIAEQVKAMSKPAAPAPAPAPAPEADDTNPNRVKVERQSNGVLSFSGGPNIGQDGGDITYSGARTGGGGDRVSTVPGMSQAQVNAALTNPDGSRWSAQDNAIMQANMRDGIDAYRGTSRGARGGVTSFGEKGGNGILSNEYEAGRRTATAIEAAARLPRSAAAAALGVIGAREAGAMRLQSDQMQNATTARGQDITAANNGAQNQLAAQRLGLDGQRVGIESTRAENEGRKLAGDLELQGFGVRSAGRVEAAQKTLLDPKATPEQRKLAQSTLAALNGKTAADRLQMVNMPDTVDAMGQRLNGGQVPIRINEDGSIEQVSVGAQQVRNIATDPRALAIKNNTGLSMAEKQQQLKALGYQ